MVSVFPSFETTFLTFWVIFPSFLRTSVQLFASMRFQAVVLYAVFVVTVGWSLPSSLMFTLTLSGLIGFPSCSVPTANDVKSDPFISYVIVRLLGAGPGMNFDFARLIFHVPMRGSLSAATDASAPTRHNARTIGTLR